MIKDDCFWLGNISSVNIHRHEFFIAIEADNTQYYKDLESILVDYDGDLVPFFIVEVSVGEQDLLIVPEKDEEIGHISGCDVYLPLSSLPVLENEDQFYFHEITNADVYDNNGQWQGIAEEVLEMPGQDVLKINHNGKEILLPLVDETIIRFDREAKILYVNFPDGLLDIYLNS